MATEATPIRRRGVLKSMSIAAFGSVFVTRTTAAQSASGTQTESIQDAIDAASPGDDIVIESGTYDEHITVDVDDITLLGPNAGRSGAGEREAEATITGRVVLTGDDTELDGFEITPPPATDTFHAEAIRVSNNPCNVTIANNIIHDFKRDDPTGGFYGVDGINIFGGNATDPIENVTICGNAIHRLRNEDVGGAAGISIQGNVRDATIRENVVTRIGEMVTPYCFGVVIRGTGNHNTVPTGVGVIGNTLSRIRSATASSFDGVGFEVESDGSNYNARNNRFAGNSTGVEVKEASGETTLEMNAIVDNERCGVRNMDSATLQAANNWWGHPSGPSGPDGRQNPQNKIVGKGDAVKGPVAYEPWLRQPLDHPSH